MNRTELLFTSGLRFRILKKIEVDSPVTAIEFFPDGTSLVVGTNRGKILIYDLRSISTPVQSMFAHTSPITKLICRACTQIPVHRKFFRQRFIVNSHLVISEQN